MSLGGSARAGVVTFSKRAEHSIKMSDNLDIKSFKAAVDDISLMGSYTRIDRALRLAQKELFEVGFPWDHFLYDDGSLNCSRFCSNFER